MATKKKVKPLNFNKVSTFYSGDNSVEVVPPENTEVVPLDFHDPNQSTEDKYSSNVAIIPDKPYPTDEVPPLPTTPVVSQFDEAATAELGPGTVRPDYQQNLAARQAQQNPTQVVPQLGTYDKAKKEYFDTLNKPANKQGKAAQIAFQIFQGMANFGAALQGQPVQPFQWLGQAKKDIRDQQAARKFAPALQQEQIRQQEEKAAYDLRKTQMGAVKEEADAITAVLNSVRQRNPKFVEMLEKQGFVTKEQALFARENGWGEIPVGDFRKYEDKERGGITYQSPETGAPNWQRSNIPVDPTALPVRRTLKDGTPYYTTGVKAADNEAQEAARQAQLDMEAGKFNMQQLQAYEDDLQRWNQSEAQRMQDNDKIITDMGIASKEAQSRREQAQALRTQATKEEERDPKEASRLRTEAIRLEAEAKVQQTRSDDYYLQSQRSKPTPMPKRPAANLQAPNITEKVMTKAEYDQLVAKQGKAKIDKLVKDGKWTVK